MKVCVAVLTYNRIDLFRQTIESLKKTEMHYTRVILDNGSTDGTAKLVASMAGGICNQDGNRAIGHGVRLAIEAAMETEPDVVLLTADDYLYAPNWLERLIWFWAAAPENVALCSAVVEPIYHWNTILDAREIGVWALQRRTVPGANWSFRASLWPELNSMIPDNRHSYDRRVCETLQERGYRIYAVPLAEHAGAGRRSWKN